MQVRLPGRFLARAAAMGAGVLEGRGRLDIGLSDEQAGGTMDPEQVIPVDRASSADGPLMASGPRMAQLYGALGAPILAASGR
jgi:hypothetical protein